MKLKTLLYEVTLNLKFNQLKKAIMNVNPNDISDIDENISDPETLNKRKIQLIKMLDELENTNPELLETIIKYADNVGASKLLEDEFFQKIVKAVNSKGNYKYLNFKTKKSEKQFNIDKVSLFKDLIDDHLNTTFTRNLLKNLYEAIMNSNFSPDDKISFIQLISDPNNLIKGETFNTEYLKGNVDDYVSPEILNSPLYPIVKKKLLSEAGGKATGKGERYLMVFGADSGVGVGSKGDVVINDIAIEVKEGTDTASSIDTGLKENKINIDTLNKKLLNKLGIGDEEIDRMNLTQAGKRKKGNRLKFNDNTVVDAFRKAGEEESKNLLKMYFSTLYVSGDRGLTEEELNEVVDIVYNNIGKDNKSIAKLILPYIFRLYKKNKGFDVFLLINRNGDFISTNSNEPPKGLEIADWVLVQGGNTYTSLPPGYINIK
jgi:hypothetical protein